MTIPNLVISILIMILGIVLSGMSKTKRRYVSIGLALFLFLYKLTEYTIYGLNMQLEKIPLEFSTMTYFIFSIAVLFNIKSIKTIAAFMSFVSGLGYLITYIILGQAFHTQNGFFITSMALINHSIVYLGSMMMLKDITWSHKEEKKILIFSALYVIYVSVASELITFSQPFIFIRLLLGAEVLNQLLPHSTHSSYMYLLYFLSIYLIYKMLIMLFYSIHHMTQHTKEGRHEHTV